MVCFANFWWDKGNMKRNFDLVLVTLDGAPIPAGPSVDAGLLTLRSISTNALITAFEDERSLAGTEKLRRYQLALRINVKDQGNIELSVEEVALLKQLIGKAYAPLVVGQAYLALEAD